VIEYFSFNLSKIISVSSSGDIIFFSFILHLPFEILEEFIESKFVVLLLETLLIELNLSIL